MRAPRGAGAEEFRFITPEIRVGTSTLQVANQGAQPHEMIVARLAAGVTLEEVFAFEGDPLEAGMVTVVGGWRCTPRAAPPG